MGAAAQIYLISFDR